MNKKVIVFSLAILIIGISAYYSNWFTFKENGIPFRLEEQADECEANFSMFLSKSLDGIAVVDMEFGKRELIEGKDKNIYTFYITIDGKEHVGNVEWYHNEDRIDIFYNGKNETTWKMPEKY